MTRLLLAFAMLVVAPLTDRGPPPEASAPARILVAAPLADSILR